MAEYSTLTILYGPTNTGKSRDAQNKEGTVYSTNSGDVIEKIVRLLKKHSAVEEKRDE